MAVPSPPCNDQHRLTLQVALFPVWALFFFWYTNWKGALTQDEVEHYIVLFQSNNKEDQDDPKKLKILRGIIESDTGKPFVMTNLFELNSSDKDAENKLMVYGKLLIPAILSRGFHPIFIAQVRAPSLDLSGVLAESVDGESVVGSEYSWSQTQLNRYRSRRDFINIISNPKFEEFHHFIIEALAKTIAIPAEAKSTMLLGGDFESVVGLALPCHPHGSGHPKPAKIIAEKKKSIQK